MFEILADEGLLDPSLARKLSEAAGQRNVLVHGYLDVDDRMIVDTVRHDLGDLDDYVSAIARLVTESDQR